MDFKSLIPFGSTSLRRRDDPFGALQREVDRLFEDFGRGFGLPAETALSPRLDVSEDDKAITVTAELPGVEQNDVKVELSDGVLTIHGEKKAESEKKNGTRHVVERSYGAFARSVSLPDGIDADAVKADMEKGVLKITLPKLPGKAAKTIEVKSAA